MNRRTFVKCAVAASAAPASLAAQSAAPAPNLPPLPPAGADGWVSLINGRNLESFYTMLDKSGKGVAEKKGMVTFENGLLHMMGNLVTDEPQEPGYLATTREFSNYHLRAEYKYGVKRFPPRVDQKRDNGILYHLVGEDKVWPTCVECQVQEGDTCDYFLLGGARGSAGRGGGYIGGRPTPASGAPQPAPGQPPPVSNRKLRDQGGDFENRDGWNLVEVIVREDRSVHILNGVQLNAMSGFEQPDPQNPGQYIPLTRGKIAIEIEYAETWYRRLEIKSLA